MFVVLLGSILSYVFGIALFLIAIFLILLVLVQRGRGGGLTGALGGMGGQSAFGAKAGDTFTRVTMVAATIWILLCMASIRLLSSQDPWQAGDSPPGSGGAGAITRDATEGTDQGAAATESPDFGAAGDVADQPGGSADEPGPASAGGEERSQPADSED
jgi:preprotein translocase subunit SecG